MMTTADYYELIRSLRTRAHGDDDLALTAADAMEELLEQVQTPNHISVATPMGVLVARCSGFGAHYPGFWIDLWPKGQESDAVALALIEYTSSEFDLPDREKGYLISRVYQSPCDELPQRIVHTGLQRDGGGLQ